MKKSTRVQPVSAFLMPHIPAFVCAPVPVCDGIGQSGIPVSQPCCAHMRVASFIHRSLFMREQAVLCTHACSVIHSPLSLFMREQAVLCTHACSVIHSPLSLRAWNNGVFTCKQCVRISCTVSFLSLSHLPPLFSHTGDKQS